MFVWRTILLVSTYHCHQAIQCIFYHEMYLFSTKYFIWFIVKILLHLFPRKIISFHMFSTQRWSNDIFLYKKWSYKIFSKKRWSKDIILHKRWSYAFLDLRVPPLLFWTGVCTRSPTIQHGWDKPHQTQNSKTSLTNLNNEQNIKDITKASKPQPLLQVRPEAVKMPATMWRMPNICQFIKSPIKSLKSIQSVQSVNQEVTAERVKG